MYAIVEIAGQQFRVKKDQKIFTHRLEGKEGDKVSFYNVLLIDNEGKINIGSPKVSGASVSATILKDDVQSDKVIVFKKKRRKGYRKKGGHRQQMTELLINDIKG